MLRATALLCLACFALATQPIQLANAEEVDPQGTWICYYKFTCTMYGTPYEYVRIPGEGQSEEAAYQAAEAFAQELRDECLSQGHTATDPVRDLPCTPPVGSGGGGPGGEPGGGGPGNVTIEAGGVNIEAARVTIDAGTQAAESQNQADEDPLERIEHRAVTKNGTTRGVVSYGRAAQFRDVSEAAWNQLMRSAAAEGGIVPGTAETRREPVYTHFAFQVIKSTDAAKKLHREYVVLGKSAESKFKAYAACQRSAAYTIAELSRLGETARTDGSISTKKVLSGKTMKQCMYQCRTRQKWTVVASAYDVTDAAACTLAEETAKQASANYGGAKKCKKIDPHEQP